MAGLGKFVLAAALGLVAVTRPVAAQQPDYQSLIKRGLWDGETWLVMMKPGAAASEKTRSLVQRSVPGGKSGNRFLSVHIPKTRSSAPTSDLRLLRSDNAVESVLPDWIHPGPRPMTYSKKGHPANEQGPWQFAALNFPDSLRDLPPKKDIVVAVIDDAFMLNHPSFDGFWHVNGGEIPGNGIDDDGNGYIDDTVGYDFADKDADPSPDSNCRRLDSHGTHVASLVASNDFQGARGIAPNIRMMPLKISGYNDKAGICHMRSSAILAAIDYAIENGANIINLSFGNVVSNINRAKLLEKAGERGVLVVAAAGNDGILSDMTEDQDGVSLWQAYMFDAGEQGESRAYGPKFPIAWAQVHDHMIGVAASGPSDPGDLVIWGKNWGLPLEKWPRWEETAVEQIDGSFRDGSHRSLNPPLYQGSNFGPESVSLLAPGGSIQGAVPVRENGSLIAGMEEYGGTSMASPIVAGAAAWLWGQYPDMSPEIIKLVLQLSSRYSEKLADKVQAGGIVDIAAAHDLMRRVMEEENGDTVAVLSRLKREMPGQPGRAEAPVRKPVDIQAMLTGNDDRSGQVVPHRQRPASGSISSMLTGNDQGQARNKPRLADDAPGGSGDYNGLNPPGPKVLTLETSGYGDRFTRESEGRLSQFARQLPRELPPGWRIYLEGELASLAADYLSGVHYLSNSRLRTGGGRGLAPNQVRISVKDMSH